MKLSFFIAHRLAFNKQKAFTSFIIKIAITAIAISVSVMIIGTAITRGYQKVIQNKFYDTWGHLHITQFLPEPSNLLNDETMPFDSNFMKEIQHVQHVKSVSSFRLQSCIAKSNDDMEGIILKGIQQENNQKNITPFLTEGMALTFNDSNYSNQILISQKIATKLQLKLHQNVLLYFLNKSEFQPKARKVVVAGIYSTGLEEYDDVFVICDAKLISSVNDDSTNLIQGYELSVDEFKNRPMVEAAIQNKIDNSDLQIYPLEKRFENVFSWLELMRTNENVIMIIMLIIAVINIITAFLILILERTRMIGVLKALGMKANHLIQIFLYSSLYILIAGLLIGTIVGVSLCILQQKFNIIKLNESAYFIKSVPISLSFNQVALINIMTVVICMILLLIPSIMIKKLSPTKAIRFS